MIQRKKWIVKLTKTEKTSVGSLVLSIYIFSIFFGFVSRQLEIHLGVEYPLILVLLAPLVLSPILVGFWLGRKNVGIGGIKNDGNIILWSVLIVAIGMVPIMAMNAYFFITSGTIGAGMVLGVSALLLVGFLIVAYPITLFFFHTSRVVGLRSYNKGGTT